MVKVNQKEKTKMIADENVDPKEIQKNVGQPVNEDHAGQNPENKKQSPPVKVLPKTAKKKTTRRKRQQKADTSSSESNPPQAQQEEQGQAAPQLGQAAPQQGQAVQQRQAVLQHANQEAPQQNGVINCITISDDEEDGKGKRTRPEKSDKDHAKDVVKNHVDAVKIAVITLDDDDDITAFRPDGTEDDEIIFLGVQKLPFKHTLQFRRKLLTPEQEAALRELRDQQEREDEEEQPDKDEQEVVPRASKRKRITMNSSSSSDEDAPSTSTKKRSGKKQKIAEELATAKYICEEGEIAPRFETADTNVNCGLVDGKKKLYYAQELYERLRDSETGKMWYLVLWRGYNFTWATYEMEESIKTRSLIQKFNLYERGMQAIMKDLSDRLDEKYPDAGGNFWNFFSRTSLPDPRLVFKMNDVNLLNKLKDEEFCRHIGYWNVKRLQGDWMRVIDPYSSGLVAPLYIENWHNRDVPSFTYINRNVVHKEAKKYWARIDSQASAYDDNNMPCACVDAQGMPDTIELKFTSQGRITNFGPWGRKVNPVCYQCSEYCACEGKCSKNFIDKGRKIPLCVFYEPRVFGYGVRAVEDIKKGIFITEYVGEFLTKKMAADRPHTYQFNIEGMVIDSLKMGNESRFVTHSCDPNVAAVAIYIAGKMPRVILVSKKDIKAGEELLLDYHCDYEARGERDFGNKPDDGKLIDCKCGSKKCRSWLLG